VRIRAPERRIAIILHDRVDLARIETALRDSAILVPIEGERSLHAAIARQDVSATIVTLHGKRLDDAIGCVRRTKDRFPSHLLLVYFDEAAIPTAALTEVIRLGADELIKYGRDDLKGLLAPYVEEAAQGNLVRSIRDRLRPRLDPAVSQIVEHILSVSHKRLTVEQVASNLGIHRRTLVSRLAARGYPAPQALLGWCRLLLAARLMEERGRTLDSIALQLDFCSVSGLVNQFRRYTALGTRELRHRGQGPFESVLAAFLDTFDAPSGFGPGMRRRDDDGDWEPLAAAPER
jgi:AraC-like DNA-binding protein